MVDPNNPVVQLCTTGMQAEVEKNFEEAHHLFTQAWEAATDDYEACIAAHFLARHQERAEDVLYWNRLALIRAQACGRAQDGSPIADFYPSLYLNMGYSYELLGNATEAKRYYELAAARAESLPSGRYGDIVRYGIAAGCERTRLGDE